MPKQMLTWKNVWARRMDRAFLLNRASPDSLVDMVSAVCGIHAQVMPAAELSIGIRVDGMTKRDVQSALWEKRLLVKTFGLRGTIHLFPSHELPLWTAALSNRTRFDPRRYEAINLSPTELAAILDAMREALNGERLTMKQLGEQIVERAGSWAGEMSSYAWGGAWPRWRKSLGEAAQAGILCYGPPVGNEVTFVRADQWTGINAEAWQAITPEDALAEIFRRYLKAYGPATTRDFAQWFNIPPTAAREMAKTIASELEEVDVEGYRCVILAGDSLTIDPTYDTEPLPARLLPHFDCYVLGCHPRKELLPPDWADHTPTRTTPSQLQTLLLDGKVAGLWERQTKSGRVDITVEPFGPLNKQQEQSLEEEAARIGRTMEAEATLTIGHVSVRPHL